MVEKSHPVVVRLEIDLNCPTLDPEDETRLRASTAIKMLLRVFDQWQLTLEQQANLLEVTESTLVKYRNAESVPRRKDQIRKIGVLLWIHHAGRRVYDAQGESEVHWVRREQTTLGGLTPVDSMLRDGLKGIQEHFAIELA